MKDIEHLLADHNFFRGMDQADLACIAGCAHNETFEPGQTIFREGQPANTFYIIRQGDVALMLRDNSRGPLTIQTLHDGDVLGWSWLFPPYQCRFEARANTVTRVTTFDGACLRNKCEQTPKMGYELMKRFAGALVDRFAQTRMQLIDVYGKLADGS